MFAGIGPEINGYTRSGFAFGAGLQFGLDLNENFSLGQRTAFFTDFDSVRVVELLIFFRYYLPWLHWPSPLNGDGPFVQAEAGTALVLEHGYHKHDEVFPSFAGGAALGWRFNLQDLWYVEPALRLGYPYVWGVGVTAGIRFKNKSHTEALRHREEVIAEVEQVTEIREVIVERIVDSESDARWLVLSYENDKGDEEHMLLVRDGDGRLRIQTQSVVFRANHSDFTGLSAAILDGNANTLRRVAQMLNTYKNYNVLIEGHANPTTPEGRRREAEESVLRRLSEERARRVSEELVRLGVDRDRLTVTGMGSSAMVVPYNEHNNTWKNRRVEFILLEGDNNDDTNYTN